MNNAYLLIIPVVIGIAAGIYLYNTDSKVTNNESETSLTSQKLIENGSPIIGETNADITILEWGDYQCTFCYKFHQSSLKIINEEYIQTGKANLVFKDFPLNGPDSLLAAQASYCAEDQGKYWEYHDELYLNWGGERTGWITNESLNEFAKTVNLNLLEFNTCLDDKKYEQRVKDLESYGKEIGIDATPSFLIFNDQNIIKIRGNQPMEVFRQAISELQN